MNGPGVCPTGCSVRVYPRAGAQQACTKGGPPDREAADDEDDEEAIVLKHSTGGQNPKEKQSFAVRYPYDQGGGMKIHGPTLVYARSSEAERVDHYQRSMPVDRLELEEQAHAAFVQFAKEARKVRSAFESAGLVLPDRLRRFLHDEQPAAAAPAQPRLVIPPLPAPPRPAEAGENWIWVPAADMTIVGLVRCVLRASAGPVARDALLESLRKHRINVNPGSVANIGTQLDKAGEITRTDTGWTLVDSSMAPVINGSNAWGATQSVFESYELAARRRSCIVHVLRLQPDGLQPMQLLKQLEQCDWLHTPLSKDLIKADLQTLDDQGRAKRIGNSGKWRATEPIVDKF
jgi:hypothetical protein